MASVLYLAVFNYVSALLRSPFSLGLVILFLFRALLSSPEFSYFLLQALSLFASAVLEFIRTLEFYQYALNVVEVRKDYHGS